MLVVVTVVVDVVVDVDDVEEVVEAVDTGQLVGHCALTSSCSL